MCGVVILRRSVIWAGGHVGRRGTAAGTHSHTRLQQQDLEEEGDEEGMHV